MTRPATDSLREAFFSWLGDRVSGLNFADLFAGTGAYGLEAWSRGAIDGCFVERDRRCLNCLRDNIRRVAKSAGQDSDTLSVYCCDVFRWGVSGNRSFDIVFADPPYDGLASIEGRLFDLAGKTLTEEGLFVLEKPRGYEPSAPSWKIEKRLGKAGRTGPSLTVYRKRLG